MIRMQNGYGRGVLLMTLFQLQIMKNGIDKAWLSKMRCASGIAMDINSQKILDRPLHTDLIVLPQSGNNCVNNV
jgi:hypothetical protein